MSLTETQIMWIRVSTCYVSTIIFGIFLIISMNLDTHNAIMMIGKIMASVGAATGGLFCIWRGSDELP